MVDRALHAETICGSAFTKSLNSYQKYYQPKVFGKPQSPIMRGKRSKQYRKLMHQYGLTFGFRDPYQVLLSSQIIQDAARCKMRLGAMLENTLHGPIKPMITQCCIRHLYTTTEHKDQAEKDAWIDVAKQAERRRCGHHELDEPLSELECLKSVVDPKDSGTNKNRYVLATQDVDVRKYMRSNVAGVPMIYVARSVMILEPMSGKTEDVREREEKSKIRAGLIDRRRGTEAGEKRKRDVEEADAKAEAGEDADGAPAAPKKRKMKGPKGPNPLSVRKTKKASDGATKGHSDKDDSARLRTPNSASKAPRNNAGADASANGQDSNAADEKPKRKRKRKPTSKNADIDEGGVPVGDDE